MKRFTLGAALALVAAAIASATGQGEAGSGAGADAAPAAMGKYAEAPMLAALVAAGSLPPVDERLPLEPLVVEPIEAIGTYGGSLAVQISNPRGWEPGVEGVSEPLIGYDYATGDTLLPNLAASWDLAEDGMTLTLRLREGVRWSDGEPLVAEDITFFWNDVNKNQEILGTYDGGVLPEFLRMKIPETIEALDEYTVQLTYDSPYFMAPYMISGFANYGIGGTAFLPKHVYTQWHIDYNEDATSLAKEAGFDHWYQHFNSKRIVGILSPRKPGIPAVGPWALQEASPSGAIFDRNAYYFKVDTAGNQLPYIDKLIGVYIGDGQSNLLRTINGEFDIASYALTLDDFPVIRENEEAGGYQTRIMTGATAADVALRINWNYHGDEEIAAILADKRFRQALSVAINREEVNELIAKGLGIPMQWTANHDLPYFEGSWGNAYAAYDPAQADALLDDLGMTARDANGYRMTPGGKPFLFTFDVADNSTMTVKSSELLAEYWEAVGIQVNLNIGELGALVQKLISKQWLAFGQEVGGPSSTLEMLIGGLEGWNSWATFNDWWRWNSTGGEGGIEPPDQIKRIFEINNTRQTVPVETVIEGFKEAYDWVADTVPVIGVLGYVGKPIVWKAALGNVDTSLPTQRIGGFRAERLYTFYWKS